MTYNEDKKEFAGSWRTDTEHLEGVLTAFSEKDILLESSTIEEHIPLINSYIKKKSFLKFNGKNQFLEVSIIEVNFSETIVHFEPLKCKRKLKSIEMENNMLIDKFPNQQNMLQINYKGKMYSMLLSASKNYDKVSINE
ncbi:MAG: hypothetical protein KJP21_09325 [Bacteroidia bacterium]|nr:hypothetical protein [Bacteroidia bacterium]